RLLAYLDDRLDAPPVDSNLAEDRVGGEVVVPDAVVDGLEVPHTLPRFRLEADEGLGEQVVPVPVTTVVVVRRSRRRQVDIVQLRIVDAAAPDVHAAGVLSRVAQPRFVPGLAGFGERVKRPPQLS